MALQSMFKGTVLVIDDDKAILEVLGLLLERKHYNVLSAFNLEDAENVWQVNRYHIDAILSDKTLKDGQDCSAFLRKLHLESPHLPLIVMSGDMQDDWN